MKKTFFALSVAALIYVSIFAATKDDEAVDFVKTLLIKSLKADVGGIDALRYYQFTATTAKNNPSAYVLSAYGKSALQESGLVQSDKGRMLIILSDRSGSRIKKLWDANKEELFSMFPEEKYNELIKSEVDSLVKFHDSPEYSKFILKIKKINPRPDTATIDKAGAVTEWSGYRELSFWHRRSYEKNEAVVFSILKELQQHYTK